MRLNDVVPNKMREAKLSAQVLARLDEVKAKRHARASHRVLSESPPPGLSEPLPAAEAAEAVVAAVAAEAAEAAEADGAETEEAAEAAEAAGAAEAAEAAVSAAGGGEDECEDEAKRDVQRKEAVEAAGQEVAMVVAREVESADEEEMWFPRPRGRAPMGGKGRSKTWCHSTGAWIEDSLAVDQLEMAEAAAKGEAEEANKAAVGGTSAPRSGKYTTGFSGAQIPLLTDAAASPKDGYRCGRCGQLKKGHVCSAKKAPTSPAAAMQVAAVAAALAEAGSDEAVLPTSSPPPRALKSGRLCGSPGCRKPDFHVGPCMEEEEPASKRPRGVPDYSDPRPLVATTAAATTLAVQQRPSRTAGDASAFRCQRNPACIRGFRHGGAPGACKIVDEDTAAAMAQRLADAVMADGEAARSVGKQETRDVPELVD